MAASPKHFSVEHSTEHGLIEYTTENAEAFIGFTKIERNDSVISFWKGGFYQGSLNTETNRLFYEARELGSQSPRLLEWIEDLQPVLKAVEAWKNGRAREMLFTITWREYQQESSQ